MADQANMINVVVALRRASANEYACLVRWVLGTGDDLPRDDDHFLVTLRLRDQQGNETDVACTRVAPRRYMMLDPPRVERPMGYDDAGTLRWLVADKPTVGVDCDAANSGDLQGKAFGVCHLLKEADPTRVAWRAAGIMHRSLALRPPATPMLMARASGDGERNARAFAQALLASGVRPLHARSHLARAYAELMEHATAVAAGATRAAPELLRLEGADIGEQFAHAALVIHMLAERATLEALDKAVTSAAQTRSHIRVRALHGGEMIDYWADPDGMQQPIDELARGKRYPTAELIGAGCLFEIDAARIDEWVTYKNTLVAYVAQEIRPPRPDRPLSSSEPGNMALGDRREHYEEGNWPLDWTFLKRAQLTGSSHLPPPPQRAWVEYAMYQGDAAATRQFETGKGPHLTYATGDGRVEIHIRAPQQDDDKITVAAFNVYGMWEEAATQRYFDDPTLQPDRKELAPWLITRRYSYARDLVEAFPPPAAGPPHPALLDVLASPPWQPVLRRPERVADKTDGADDTLPNLGSPGTAVYAFDLRKGMLSGRDAPPGVFVGWDPSGAADTRWTPERMRDGTNLPASARKPQRYRFWVTSVDAFEQESEPVPVATNDVDAGEAGAAFLYSPVRRAPLLPPPGSNDAEGTALELRYDPVAGALNIDFETPWENEVAGRGTDAAGAQARVDAKRVEATVAVWRRRLMKRAKAARINTLFTLTRPMLPDLPQWQDTARELIEQGWTLLSVMTIASSAHGDRWTATAVLPADYLGWEYICVIGFQVTSAASAFFAPNVLKSSPLGGREAVCMVRKPDGSYEAHSKRVNETPRSSDVARTAAVAIPNPHPARAPAMQPANARVWPAKPVPPPPGVRRDLVLMRLVTQGVSRDGQPIEPAPWLDTNVSLTLGQAAMCEAAIARTDVGSKPLPPLDPRLVELRTILARAFVRNVPPALRTSEVAASEPLRQHATLGFRGMLDVQWHYTPLAEVPSPGVAPEAEAVQFRIYATRVSQEPTLARPFATFSANGTLAGDRYRITLIGDGDDGWKSVRVLQHPAMAAIESADGAPSVFGEVVDAGEDPAGLYVRLRVREEAPLPNAARIDFYVAQPLAEIAVTSFDASTSYTVLLPIGGGEAEVYSWWIVSVSAQGIESRLSTHQAVIRDFGPTLEPPTPRAFHVAVPTDFVAHTLDTVPHRRWLPADVARPDDPKYFPRLVLTWEAFPAASNAALAIEREERQVARVAERAPPALTRSPWAAIKAIETASEQEDLEAADIEAITGNWLVGFPVDVENVQQSAPEHVPHDDPQRRLDASCGLKTVPSPEPPDTVTGKRTRPAFIDYYGRNSDMIVGMDGNWEFRYRARAFRDLGDRLPPNWRYLLSSPTEWSAWLRPETPPLTLYCDEGVASRHDAALVAPRVRIRVVPGRLPPAYVLGLRYAIAPEHRWEYRILVRRLLDVPRPNTGGATRPLWIDIGAPLRLTTTEQSVSDDEIDRAWPEHSPSFHYRVMAQQFLVVQTPDGEIEKLVRGFEEDRATCEFDIVVPVVQAADDEVEITKTLYVA